MYIEDQLKDYPEFALLIANKCHRVLFSSLDTLNMESQSAVIHLPRGKWSELLQLGGASNSRGDILDA